MPAKYNLDSPNGIRTECELDDLRGWHGRELVSLKNAPLVSIIETVLDNEATFLKWPSRPLLLWQGVTRESGQKHKFPAHIRDAANERNITLDPRENGPAVASFLFSGGDRPQRYGSTNKWSVHHLYSGKFPYPGRPTTLHSNKDGSHFSQSAGLVAVHAVLDQLFDEIPSISWYFRAEAYRRFRYDPDDVFSPDGVTNLGFSTGTDCPITHRSSEMRSAVKLRRAR